MFCVLPGAVWRACVGLGCCAVLLPPFAIALCPVLARGWVLSWGAVLCFSVVPPVVRSAVVCVVFCSWCCDVSFALAGAVCCCLWFPRVRCLVWLPAVVFRWRALFWVPLPGRVACCPAVCCGLLWCPAPLFSVLCSVVLCCRVVPCCGALLSVFLCWFCWFVSSPCVCGAVLRCASCCSVPVWSVLLVVPCAVACRCVLWCVRPFLLVVLCCFVRAGWRCVLLPVVAKCSLLGLVARCCLQLACFVAGAPAWPGGLPACPVLWFVAVSRFPVLFPVFSGAVLPCGAVLWSPAVRFPMLVVLVCVLSLCVRCCGALCVVLFGTGLVCAVVGALCCGVSLCVVVSALAFCGVVVLPCCVVWCVVVSCCAVLCSVVLVLVALLLGLLCVLLCCGFSFILGKPFFEI